jgi:hypothetical protein
MAKLTISRQLIMNPRSAIRPKVASGNGFVSALEYQNVAVQSGAFPRWLLLTAILLIPASLDVRLAGDGVKFTPGRAAIALLLLPALLSLFKPARRLVTSDVFAFLTSVWMIGSRIPDDGLNPSAVASVIEFFGGYLVGRAFFYGPHALKHFLQIFKVTTFIVIMIAVLDQLFQQNVAETAVAMILQTPWKPVQYRFGIVRAASTIEMAELFGTFCCVAASVFLFLENNKSARYCWTGFSFFGCLLALSSGPLLVFVIIIAFYAYDQLFQRYATRWKIINGIFLSFISIVFITANHPLSWVVSHMTLDPETGYFRIYVFDYVSEQISLSPLIGFGFSAIGNDEFLSTTTVDNVWLVCAARYGVPMIILFLLTNLATVVGTAFRSRDRSVVDPFMTRAATGLTQILMTFMLVGITVHFWNAMWMLWAVCIGIRGSIKEWLVYRSPTMSEPGWIGRIPNLERR